MKNSSQVIGLPIMGVKEGLEFGLVQDIVIDPQKKKIRSVILHGSKSEYDFRELKLGDIMGIGKDYVITQSIANAKSTDLSDMGMTLLNMKCIASSGDLLGNVKDFTFEEKTGDIQTLQIDTGIQISGENILSFSNNLLFADSEGKAEKASQSSLEKEQNEYMLGRTVKADIETEDGVVIIKKGTLVTAETIRLADEAGVTVDLTLNVE